MVSPEKRVSESMRSPIFWRSPASSREEREIIQSTVENQPRREARVSVP